MALAMFVLAMIFIALSIAATVMKIIEAVEGYDLADLGSITVILALLVGVALAVLAIINWGLSLA